MINNNKGFAFSTMLYGLLAVMMLILLLIFNLYKGTSDELYYYSSTVDEKLNECAINEVALEICYSSRDNCVKEENIYFGCLGINKENTESHENLFTKLSGSVVTSSSGLYKLSDDSYIYRGTPSNNYVKYSGRIWRIISFTKTGEAKIIADSSNAIINNTSWDSGENKEWQESTLYNQLSGNYYASLSDKDLLQDMSWKIGRPDIDNEPNLENLMSIENNALSSTNLYIGLINPSDYARASLNANCETNPLTPGSCNSNNFLASMPTWTLNSSNGENKDAFYTDGTGIKQVTVTETESKIARPVVYLKSSVVIMSGDGTSSSPYLIG